MTTLGGIRGIDNLSIQMEGVTKLILKELMIQNRPVGMNGPGFVDQG